MKVPTYERKVFQFVLFLFIYLFIFSTAKIGNVNFYLSTENRKLYHPIQDRLNQYFSGYADIHMTYINFPVQGHIQKNWFL